ncbi:hypothetical protein DFH08DRAFT_380103 [Mycena albidolilacea]|uniref:DUF423-domain-containing protein n=1 Tax=Mycena albidolilacea TaxID=1033008 RepID=A0AAD7AKW2_9AGAR|nr:hypothetical protein DFH08DRAFT_380103 [Mycena albidolilacea]
MVSVTPSLLWRLGSSYAAVGIMAGAFGGVSADSIASFQTASHYAIFNGLALLLLSLHPRFSTHRFAGPAVAAGAALFSGSVWALVLDRERFRFLGPVTPLGGVVMIAGYVSMAL